MFCGQGVAAAKQESEPSSPPQCARNQRRGVPRACSCRIRLRSPSAWMPSTQRLGARRRSSFPETRQPLMQRCPATGAQGPDMGYTRMPSTPRSHTAMFLRVRACEPPSNYDGSRLNPRFSENPRARHLRSCIWAPLACGCPAPSTCSMICRKGYSKQPCENYLHPTVRRNASKPFSE